MIFSQPEKLVTFNDSTAIAQLTATVRIA